MSDYYQPNLKDFSQGDILDLAPHCRLPAPLVQLEEDASGGFRSAANGKAAIAELRFERGLLMTADCDIDKPKSRFWHVCPVHPISLLRGEDQTTVRKNKLFKFLHLPAFNQMQESFVDLSSLTTISSDIVRTCSRSATLSDTARAALYVQYLRLITRWDLNTVTCPSCTVTFNPADVLPVRSV